VLPDPIYNSTLVEKFVNSMMWDGTKNTAQNLFYDAMEKIRDRSGDDPLKLFKKAVENVKPVLEVKTRRDFTSSTGLMFSTAFLNSFSGSSCVFFWMMSMDL
jgi:ribosomal protein S7